MRANQTGTKHQHTPIAVLMLDMSGRRIDGPWAYREETCRCGAVRVSVHRPDRVEHRPWVRAEKWANGR